MPSETSIQSALNARLATLADRPPTAWPNAKFDPEGADVWLEVHHLPRETYAPMLGDDSAQDYGGIYQITVLTKTGQYETAALDMADEIMALFPRGDLTNDVRVRKTSRAGGYRDGAHWRVPVSIHYRGII